jgi:hypothetical protein
VWSTEHNRETTASPAPIWRLWSNVATWGEWNADIEQIEMSGPVADTVGPELGPEISGDFPETLAALTERAEAMDQDPRGGP